MAITTPGMLSDGDLLAHARGAARKDELHGPVNEVVGPDKLHRWGSRSMMSLLHTQRGVYSTQKLDAYTDVYTDEYRQARAERVAVGRPESQ